MKIIKQLAGFVLGVAVGVCLHAALTLRALSPALVSNAFPSARGNDRLNLLTPPWVQRSLPPQVAAPISVESENLRVVLPQIAEPRARAITPSRIVRLPERDDLKEVAAASIPTGPPPVAVFPTIGYVEEAGGKAEAIILQENQVQVVHLGDVIAGRYRVTKVSPDAVDARDEMQAEFPMSEPGTAQRDIVSASVAPLTRQPLGFAPSAEVWGPPESSGHLRNIHDAKLDYPASPDAAESQLATRSDFSREDRSTLAQAANPGSDAIGFVQNANGEIESVVADGDTVRLIAPTPAISLAGAGAPAEAQRQNASIMPTPRHFSLNLGSAPAGVIERAGYTVPPAEAASGAGVSLVTRTLGDWKDRVAKLLVMFKPLGYVEHGNGELDAIVSQDDEVYIVKQGDRFAGHYRAVSVSPNAVEALEEPMRPFRPLDPRTFPGLLSAASEPAPSRPDDPPAEAASGFPETATAILPVAGHRQDIHRTTNSHGAPDSDATFIFQSLGYIETQDGDFQAVVADGSEVYLVRPGETFAGQYRATSIDPVLVLAVKAPAEPHKGNLLAAETESGEKAASKDMPLHFPLFAWATIQTSRQAGASNTIFGTDLGFNLLNSPLSLKEDEQLK